MVCLIKSKNKPLLDSYTDIMGSESAAYYVLSRNNGYSLEFTPNGERSDLFRLLLAKNNYDYEAAIIEKSEMYYPSFYNKIGGDWTMASLDSSVVDENGEPKIDYAPAKIDFSDIFSQPFEITEMDTMRLADIENNMIAEDQREYVAKSGAKGSVEKHIKKVEWLKSKQKKLVDSINKSLLEAFGLEKKTDKDGNVIFVSKEKDEFGRHLVVIRFCEYLENGKLGAYDQAGRIDAAANLIEISLTDADPSTINHELAHHYIRMFWNSEVIQNAVKKLDTGDRTEGWRVRLEEKLVDEITDRTKDVSGFWNNFGSMVKTAFKWLSSPMKQLLLRKAAIAFRLNDKVEAMKNEQDVLQFIDPTATRVYMSPTDHRIANFDNIYKNIGIAAATKLFIADAVKFYENEVVAPDSRERKKFFAYVQYFENVLADVSMPDSEFNNALIECLNFVRQSRSGLSPGTIAAIINVDLYIEEIKQLREEALRIHGASTAPATSSGSTTSSDEALGKLMLKIIGGLKTRVYEYLHTVPKEARSANDVQELIEKINSIFEYDKKLAAFISDSIGELSSMCRKLDEMSDNEYNDTTTWQLLSLWNTINGFYDPIIDIIWDSYKKDLQSIISDGVLSDLGRQLGRVQSLTNYARTKLKDANEVISKRETHNYLFGNEETGQQGVVSDLFTDEQKNRFLINFDDQLIEGKFFEDINDLQPYVGISSRSRSAILRVARNMILAASADIRHATLKDTTKIIKLYYDALPEMKKLGLKEVLSIFLEMDDRGIPTGYFVRKLNHGKFYNDLNEYRFKLIDEANEKLTNAFGSAAPQIIYDTYNNPILPVSDDATVNTILYEYSDALDEWMCDNAERMFLPDYYRKRREMLSPQTRAIMSNILSRINTIMSKCPIVKTTDASGKEHEIQATWELSPEDLDNLIQLRMQYQQLGNQYYSDGTKKSPDELKVAEEISAFNEWKHQYVSYNQDKLRFDAAIEEIRKAYGLNSLEEAKFKKLNSSIRVNPKYYDYVLSRVAMSHNAELEKLRKKRNDLRKLIDEFDKKGIDVEQKRRQTRYWDELKEVDKEIKELLESLPSGPDDEEHMWSTYFDKEFVMYDSTTTLLDHMLEQDLKEYKTTHPADTRAEDVIKAELRKKYEYTYTWTDKSGEVQEGTAVVSVFLRNIPRGASVNKEKMHAYFSVNGRNMKFTDALVVQYSQEFSDIDESSRFYNPNYDRENGQLVQPKTDKYDNSKQWDIIRNNEKIRALYDGLIEVMQKSNSLIPNRSDGAYRLPQITARRLTLLRRCSSLKEVGEALKYNWEVDWKLNERDDDDVNYEDSNVKIRVDGTRINTVPVRFIKPLERPETITSDVIGSVIAFCEMSNNFVVKTQLSTLLEAVKRQLMDRADAGIAKKEGRQSTKNVVKQLTNMMDALLYGNTTKLGDQISEFTKKQQLLIKFMTHYQRLGRKLMLAWNITSMSVGFFESSHRGLIEALLGKDYTMRDYLHAWGRLAKYIIPMMRDMGRDKVRNKLVALMQRFGISKRLRESYHSTERNRAVKLLSENLNGMFGFTVGDYMNSSFQFSMAMSNVRFIKDAGYVDNGFYTKTTLIKAIQKKNDLGYKEAKRIATALYKESGITLEDAYEFSLEDGIVAVKDEYKQYVNSVLENRVTGKCYQRLAEALGVTPQDDTPGYALWVLFKPLGTLRSYLFTVIARNWNWAHDLQLRYEGADGSTVKVDDMVDGYLDIDAGEMNIGIHLGLYGWMKMVGSRLPILEKMLNSPNLSEETKELYNYAATKVLLEVLSIISYVGISCIFKALAKGADDDDWFYRFGYLTSVRLVNSFISILDPTSLLEIIKNISTLISPLNDLINSITTLSDLLGLSGHSPLDEIQSGSYKGRTRLFRNIMRMTPFGNAYEDLNSSALKSRTNWYLQQDALVWSSLGGIFDQLWGTDSEGFKTKKQ